MDFRVPRGTRSVPAVFPRGSMGTRKQAEQRLDWKLRLVRRLYEQGYAREDILELFRFIDWLLELPAELEQRFDQELTVYEAGMGTPYITSIERHGIEKGIKQGIEQGILQGKKDLLKIQLTQRFGPLSEDAVKHLQAATTEQLDDWASRVLQARSPAELFGDD